MAGTGLRLYIQMCPVKAVGKDEDKEQRHPGVPPRACGKAHTRSERQLFFVKTGLRICVEAPILLTD